ncbi:phosphoglycolate phosphatase [Halococcus saccharolyticus]|uniref:Phosphoglycolate phosphatase n=1 Tax=Halococcus saccharolyticus DSM 5350 TaxID=1227455 RepID=M0MFG3_9EURY|nr:phosphoglycolate phosphatase [Halococcus saccharolyticus]EMA43429.1 phosphoglycolate phosphatase [Halococcus saccharolyticus DSM 5350]
MDRADDAPDARPPLAVDIDGTLTDRNRVVDPRIFDALRGWPAPVVLATGKALPYPVALCEFVGLPTLVVAENGGVVCLDTDTHDEIVAAGDRAAADRVAAAYRDAGHDLGWGSLDLVNRWRETEIAVSRDAPLAPLREIAVDHGLDVVDTGFAYHVVSPDVDKGYGLSIVADRLGRDPAEFVAIGDSANDVATFEAAGRSFAVANADEAATRAADRVTDAAYADGFLEALRIVRSSS